MAWEYLETDPWTGLETYLDYDDDTGLAAVRYENPNAHLLVDYTRALAHEGIADAGIKRGMWRYASIPPDVQVEMLQKGVNIHDPNDHPKMFALINRDYPWLKTTDKYHA